MENKKSMSTGTTILLAILIICVLGMGSFIVYDKFITSSNNSANSNSNNENNNTEQNGVDNKDYNSENTKLTDDERYTLFLENYKNAKRKPSPAGELENWQTVEGIKSMEIEENNALRLFFYDRDAIDVKNNVLNAFYVSYGNGGMVTIYTLNEDGTISYLSNDSTKDNIKFTTNSYKNVISVFSCYDYDGENGGGALETCGLDINGKVAPLSEFKK